jgi:lipid II:glycine glycyltransferase (peptidoglycan interpeptide bridge formation enzyme)
VTDVREATAAELLAWDRRAVDVRGGHVYQSRAWAEHRAGSGWSATHLIVGDGHGALVLTRPWPLIGGAGAYVPRGPVSADEPAADPAGRLRAVADWLAGRGVDVIASDAEIPAADGYGAALRSAGFQPIPELQPSRHRMSLALPPGSDDDAVRSGFSKSTRQRLAVAEGSHVRVIRYDRSGPEAGELFATPQEGAAPALDAFYSMLEATGDRRQFRFGPRSSFVAWWEIALAHGHLVYLEARLRDPVGADRPIGGLILYRHGHRLTTVHSADRAELRGDLPGVMHLLRWRAIQLALREGRDEMDLGGVDVGPDHRKPVEGDAMFGLYEHKRSFGAHWVEMTGAHERVLRSWRYAAGRVTGRVARR